ncbi:DUF2326 domain-containing protein [Gilliamella sp. wkB308]|uniref:DUF2326 domain-containing protein n=1 Tax=Gilliamella sp. wkB308 TaxID=3120263 RepID=UPI00080DBF5B|nr:DUF2326 domain-containing protein [Gilliamella apicola]OCF94719.1 hypothetical protein A9G10_01725 [Gilliamella apicola]OCF96700.1 hypothetical protein A9G10_07485 [Gilliamella apicola]OCF98219.1 hypothetical protein A9G10_06800 [Gilliamella apicola]OCF99904.1 hypothetical protein A9G10_04720 [Gilliamella apicola]
MKLSKLYSNKPDLFETIIFSSGLNVIQAEIRLPENKKKDTHNLGKSTLGKLLDFCFLSKKKSEFFLFKHKQIFKQFVFFLELELEDGSYLTIRRCVTDATRISIKKHTDSHQDFTQLAHWDHENVSFDKAKEILDSILNFYLIKPWQYRKILGYLLRSQDDYRDVFQLRKFASKHKDWKPFLAHILGFNSDLIVKHYELEAKLKDAQDRETIVKQELGGSIEDISRIDGLLLLKQQDVNERQRLLDKFDFHSVDQAKTKKLIDELDLQIATLNKNRYSLDFNRKKIELSLQKQQILFDPDEAESLYKEAGILFPEQLKKDFNQLIQFNRAITEERHTYLKEELSSIKKELTNINQTLLQLGEERTQTLSFLGETDIFNKYKQISNDLITLKTDIAFLERQKEFIHKLQELRTEIRLLDEQSQKVRIDMENDLEIQNTQETSLFSEIRLYFSRIVEDVISRMALLNVKINRKGHFDFSADILDEAGRSTSADDGHTYKKLLCVAFDLAILRAHLKDNFPRFVYHDGIFESLDDRKKINLLNVIRQYSNLGIQQIITVIDSDIPLDTDIFFDKNEIALVLHDEGIKGRLFKLPSW